ncbi:conjugal transfer protein TraH [Vibrio mediterranei]
MLVLLHRFTPWLRAAKRKTAVSLFVMVLILSPLAQASVNNQLGNYFDGLGYNTNVTSPSAFKGQSANYFSAGGLSLKNPVSNLEIGQINLPAISAGCGGIDVYGGGFSFINAGQFKQFLQNVGHAAVPLALKMGIQTLTPQLASLLDELQDWASKFNNMSLNSCEAAQSLVDATGLTSLAQNAGKEMACIRSAIADGKDSADAKAQCSGGGATAEVAKAAKKSDYDQLPVNVNIAWKHIRKNNYLAQDTELSELVMALSGTVIYDDQSHKTTLPSLYLQNQKGIELLLKGGHGADIYHCDKTDTCLHPTKSTIDIDVQKAFYHQVETTLNAIAAAYKRDAKFNDKEKAFLDITPLPVLKMLTNVMESHEPVANYAHDYAQIITAKLLSRYLTDLLHLEMAAFTDSDNSKDAERIQRTIEKMQAYLDEAPKAALNRLVQLNQLVNQRKQAERMIQSNMDSFTRTAL